MENVANIHQAEVILYHDQWVRVAIVVLEKTIGGPNNLDSDLPSLLFLGQDCLRISPANHFPDRDILLVAFPRVDSYNKVSNHSKVNQKNTYPQMLRSSGQVVQWVRAAFVALDLTNGGPNIRLLHGECPWQDPRRSAAPMYRTQPAHTALISHLRRDARRPPRGGSEVRFWSQSMN